MNKTRISLTPAQKADLAAFVKSDYQASNVANDAEFANIVEVKLGFHPPRDYVKRARDIYGIPPKRTRFAEKPKAEEIPVAPAAASMEALLHAVTALHDEVKKNSAAIGRLAAAYL